MLTELPPVLKPGLAHCEARAEEPPAQEQTEAATGDAPAQAPAASLPEEGGADVPVEQESP